MDFTLKISFLLFLLVAANGHFETGSSEDLEEKLRQIPTNQNNETMQFLKSEVKELFSGLLESLSRQLMERNSEILSTFDTLNARMLKMERHQDELPTNLERTLYENMGYNRNLSDSSNEGHTKTDLKTETSLLNFSHMISEKLSKTEFTIGESLANLSGLLIGEMRRCDAKLETSLRNLSESLGGKISELLKTVKRGTPNQTTERNGQQLPSTTTSPTTLSAVGSPAEMTPNAQLPTQTEVEKVSGNNGTIEFKGEICFEIRRKIWVLRTEGNARRENLRFLMEENNLGEEAHLSLWESHRGENIHVWNGSQTDWRKERKTGYYADLIVLTLTVKPSANPGPPPSFKLSFTSTDGTSPDEHLGGIMTKDGVATLSFPHQNAQKYSPWSYFHAVIAPQGGRPFSLTLKYLDVPGNPPTCRDNDFSVFFLEESATETNYKKLKHSSFSVCGRLGNVSEFLGTSTVAILQFFSRTSNTGTGFRMEVKTI